MKLLTIENAKTIKGEKRGYLTGILYLAPHTQSGVINVCPNATVDCARCCLFTAGRGRFDSVHNARVAKTKWLARDRESFLNQLSSDVRALRAKAERDGMVPAVRLNGTSDLPFLAHRLAEQFPDVQFYDYTKIPKPWTRTRDNYHLTFSHSGGNLKQCLDAISNKINVAVVFDTRKGDPLPREWHGVRVVDGDLSDLRFLDPRGVVVGLRAKGEAKKDQSSFVQIS